MLNQVYPTLVSLFLVWYVGEGGVVSTLEWVFFNVSGAVRAMADNKTKGLVLLIVSLFSYVALTNFGGLFPFVYVITSHPFMTLSVGLVTWLSCFLMGWVTGFTINAAHLVPEGSPMVLAPIMVLIESVSHLIRPFTLSVRLAANMMAGHLIVGLISSISLINLGGFFISVVFQSLLLVLESAVAIIQGVVFSILVLLYMLEYY